MKLNVLAVTGGEGVPELNLVLQEFRRLGYDMPDHSLHYVTYVRTPMGSALRMAWGGPEVPSGIIQQISRGCPGAVFDLGVFGTETTRIEIGHQRFANGLDLVKTFAASAVAEEGTDK
jgi:hypothetical protein